MLCHVSVLLLRANKLDRTHTAPGPTRKSDTGADALWPTWR
ncbi:hypothetical protein NY08_1842 [Rhodococcus sp. B7740]|nr:hypothetical protein NY08_1842 [Rhodococcus sp. B7740]